MPVNLLFFFFNIYWMISSSCNHSQPDLKPPDISDADDFAKEHITNNYSHLTRLMRKKAWLGWCGWRWYGWLGCEYWAKGDDGDGHWMCVFFWIHSKLWGKWMKMRFMGRNGETFFQTSKYLGRHLTSLIHHASSASNSGHTCLVTHFGTLDILGCTKTIIVYYSEVFLLQ